MAAFLQARQSDTHAHTRSRAFTHSVIAVCKLTCKLRLRQPAGLPSAVTVLYAGCDHSHQFLIILTPVSSPPRMCLYFDWTGLA